VHPGAKVCILQYIHWQMVWDQGSQGLLTLQRSQGQGHNDFSPGFRALHRDKRNVVCTQCTPEQEKSKSLMEISAAVWGAKRGRPQTHCMAHDGASPLFRDVELEEPTLQFVKLDGKDRCAVRVQVHRPLTGEVDVATDLQRVLRELETWGDAELHFLVPGDLFEGRVCVFHIAGQRGTRVVSTYLTPGRDELVALMDEYGPDMNAWGWSVRGSAVLPHLGGMLAARGASPDLWRFPYRLCALP
jgi:hypothetical protein